MHRLSCLYDICMDWHRFNRNISESRNRRISDSAKKKYAHKLIVVYASAQDTRVVYRMWLFEIEMIMDLTFLSSFSSPHPLVMICSLVLSPSHSFSALASFICLLSFSFSLLSLFLALSLLLPAKHNAVPFDINSISQNFNGAWQIDKYHT